MYSHRLATALQPRSHFCPPTHQRLHNLAQELHNVSQVHDREDVGRSSQVGVRSTSIRRWSPLRRTGRGRSPSGDLGSKSGPSSDHLDVWTCLRVSGSGSCDDRGWDETEDRDHGTRWSKRSTGLTTPTKVDVLGGRPSYPRARATSAGRCNSIVDPLRWVSSRRGFCRGLVLSQRATTSGGPHRVRATARAGDVGAKAGGSSIGGGRMRGRAWIADAAALALEDARLLPTPAPKRPSWHPARLVKPCAPPRLPGRRAAA